MWLGWPVEVLAGPVIAHGRVGIGVPGGDLDIAQPVHMHSGRAG